MSENMIIDHINVKTFPEEIINFLRENKIKTRLNSVRVIYSLILEEISFDIKSSYINRIQKYLSSNDSISITIFDDIVNGIYTKELKNACIKINNEILKCKNPYLFYNKIINKCSFLHFDDKQLEMLNNLNKDNDYSEILYILFIHAFETYKYNTPRILSERLYGEALALSKGNPLKKNLLKLSANLGNPYACVEYAEEIYDNNWSDRIKYFMKNKDYSVALWEIAFIIEHFEIDEITFKEIKKELKNYIYYSNSFEECNNISTKENKNSFKSDCLITAFKLYYYIANEKNFSKAYNSVGKLLIEEKILYLDKNKKIDKIKMMTIGKKYIKKACSLGNVHAMENLALLIKNDDYEKATTLAKIGAEYENIESCILLSNLLISNGNEIEAIKYLKYAASTNNKEAFYNLGKIYERKLDYDKAKNYYENSIKNGYNIASINLAKLYFQMYVNESDEKLKISYLMVAINILEKYKNTLNKENQNIAEKLLYNWKKML